MRKIALLSLIFTASSAANALCTEPVWEEYRTVLANDALIKTTTPDAAGEDNYGYTFALKAPQKFEGHLASTLYQYVEGGFVQQVIVFDTKQKTTKNKIIQQIQKKYKMQKKDSFYSNSNGLSTGVNANNKVFLECSGEEEI